MKIIAQAGCAIMILGIILCIWDVKYAPEIAGTGFVLIFFLRKDDIEDED